MRSYRVIYQDPDGYRTQRLVHAEAVDEAGGLTTFSVHTPGGRPEDRQVVWRLPTGQVESCDDETLVAEQVGE